MGYKYHRAIILLWTILLGTPSHSKGEGLDSLGNPKVRKDKQLLQNTSRLLSLTKKACREMESAERAF